MLEGPQHVDLSQAQQEAMTGAVHACWDKARQSDVAGMLQIRLDKLEPDGSFSVGGYDNAAHAELFDAGFFGEEASDASNAMYKCVEEWLGAQRYPGITRLEAAFHLLPP